MVEFYEKDISAEKFLDTQWLLALSRFEVWLTPSSWTIETTAGIREVEGTYCALWTGPAVLPASVEEISTGEGQGSRTVKAMHVSLGYLPKLSERCLADLQRDLNIVILKWISNRLHPYQRIKELLRVKRFLKLGQLQDGWDGNWIELSSWSLADVLTAVSRKQFAILDEEFPGLLARHERDAANRKFFNKNVARFSNVVFMEDWISLKYPPQIDGQPMCTSIEESEELFDLCCWLLHHLSAEIYKMRGLDGKRLMKRREHRVQSFAGLHMTPVDRVYHIPFGWDLLEVARYWDPHDHYEVEAGGPDLLKAENLNIQWMAAADWEDAPEYGPEYVLLREGDIVTPLLPPPEVDPEDWAYGCNERSGVIGWYPPEYLVRKMAWL
jgi:hypothetical protein